MIDLRCGRWQDVLQGETCDVICTDPPYSPRVHAGQRTGSSTRKSTLVYDSISREQCMEIAASWAPRTSFWAIIFSDHLAQRWHEEAWEAAGWYVFAPVLVLRECPTPRVSGDGPTSAAEYLTIARHKSRLPRERMGSRQGYYMAPHMNGNAYKADRWRPGGKSLATMRDILIEYTLPGDRVADPFAGGGTTLVAAAQLGRVPFGAECDPEAYADATQRLDRAFPPTGTAEPRARQAKLTL